MSRSVTCSTTTRENESPNGGGYLEAERMKCPTCGLPLPVFEGELDRPILCSGCNGWVAPLRPTTDSVATSDEPLRDLVPIRPERDDDRPRRRKYDDEYDDEYDDDFDDDLPRPRRRARKPVADAKAVTALVLGIVSLMMVCGCYWLTFPSGVTGIVFGLLSRKKPESSTYAWVGIGLSTLALVLATLFLAFFIFVQLGVGGFGPGGGGGGRGAIW